MAVAGAVALVALVVLAVDPAGAAFVVTVCREHPSDDAKAAALTSTKACAYTIPHIDDNSGFVSQGNLPHLQSSRCNPLVASDGRLRHGPQSAVTATIKPTGIEITCQAWGHRETIQCAGTKAL